MDTEGVPVWEFTADGDIVPVNEKAVELALWAELVAA